MMLTKGELPTNCNYQTLETMRVRMQMDPLNLREIQGRKRRLLSIWWMKVSAKLLRVKKQAVLSKTEN